MAMSPTLLSRVLCSGSQQGGMDNSRQRNAQRYIPGSRAPWNRSRRPVFLERKTNRPICCPAGWLIPEKSAEFSESIC
jgi:hypothetical protein